MLLDGKDVGFLDAGGVDSLVALHVGERSETVAINRRAFEIEIVGGFLHGLGHAVLDLVGAAREKRLGLADEFAIAFERNLAGAGGRAALDLMKQARPRPRLVDRIGTGAQQEGPLQGIDRAADGAGRGEGSEILPLSRAGATVLHDCGSVVIATDEDVGKRLVIPKQNIKSWPQALDKVCF